MINNRIATAAAVFAFGFASFGTTVIATAAPAAAETHTASASASGDGGPVGAVSKPGMKDHRAKPDNPEATGDRFNPTKHQLFPTKPHSPHEGQGHKGDKEQHATAPHRWAVPGLDAPAAG